MRCLRIVHWLAFIWMLGSGSTAHAQLAQSIVDLPTRPGVTQRLLLLVPPAPQAVAVLFAGGHGGLQLSPEGAMQWGKGNFLLRSRQAFAEKGIAVAVIDAPSDRQSPPYLTGFRQTPEHATDVRAIITALRERFKLPLWLVGTSRGTQSVAYVAQELGAGDGPDGIVLSSTVLNDPRGRGVLAMPLDSIRIPVLVVHHEQDGCRLCAYADVPALMAKLGAAPRKQLLTFNGGISQGDPCEAFAHHGYNGIERDVVQQTVAWMLGR
jgi:hypothetical protein